MLDKDKIIRKEACDKLCGPMQILIVKASKSETSKEFALEGSVVDDLDESSADDLREMGTNWIEAMEELETADVSGAIFWRRIRGDEEATDDEQDTLLSFLQVESN